MIARAARRRTATPPPAGGGPVPARPLPWLLPVLLFVGLFYLWPIVDALRLAFTDASLLDRDAAFSTEAIGAMLGSPALGTVLRNTAIFTLGSVVGQILLGLAIALLVVRGERNGLRGMLVMRTLVLAAWVIPGIANGIIWQMLFSEAPFGAINSALRLAGLPPVAWLSDPGNAMMSAIIATVWQGTAYSMILLYAALRSIDDTLYEAAAVDAATPWERFRFITLPELRGALLVNAILIVIMTLNTFDVIISLTGGGPGRATEVLALFTYNTVFYNFDLAGGSVLSILLMAISLALAALVAAFLPRAGRR
ncbi:carbohydrate ABC transporter permease [Wenxinia saemankumensis]|uniref:Carbohydrate ABC transporter membrane protein 1, CUT1 family n=1 Tax=Wenxinia saemankumensis TaxID=1447782 RepID=A0A1M6HFA7_9RHOB|nr:sugar ABC transporter permease [Wenxinia saemankumensis]SHJ20885.1 carbohydrate ABC transporter membrane protein 1, CUT1 family [Wenxinia saemankumensis]